MASRADYATTRPLSGEGGVLLTVDPESPLGSAGLVAGDVLVSVDGQPLRDVLDWQWHTSDVDAMTVGYRRTGSAEALEAGVRREPTQAWGAHFASALFDRVRTCRNDCAFCFMTQLPRGLRSTLYLRDDDYRLSFLQGNFVTLTNLSDTDVERIAEQHLSPLYVSLHAVSPDVRRDLVCAREDDALDRTDELLEAGIALHVQIVLVPGVNDGDELDRTLTWLAEREGIASVGVVPLGWTGHQERFARSFETPEAASAVITQIAPWQEAFAERDGVAWVYLADEFYLNAGVELPPAEHYAGFPQFENGIGIARSLLDDAESLGDELRAVAQALETPVRVVSGELAEGPLSQVLASSGATNASVLPVANRFFGGNVAVTGLLTASDLIAALESATPDGVFLIPDVIANADGLTLDDVPVAELGMRSGREVRLVSSDAAGLLEGLQWAREAPVHRKGS